MVDYRALSLILFVPHICPSFSCCTSESFRKNCSLFRAENEDGYSADIVGHISLSAQHLTKEMLCVHNADIVRI